MTALDGGASGDLVDGGKEALATGERAEQEGRYEDAIESYREAAGHAELPPAPLCVRIARCHESLGEDGAAAEWLTRVVDSSDSLRDWTAAAAILARLTERARPAARVSRRLALTGSYTTNQLAAALPLAALRFGVDLELHESLYGQYQQDLLDPASALYAGSPELILIAVHEGAAQVPRGYSDSPDVEVANEVARWRGLWDAAATRSSAQIVQHAFAVRPEAPLGHLTSATPGSRPSMIHALNRELATAAGGEIAFVDCDRLAADFGRLRWFDDRYWLRSKQAVSLEAVPLLARHTAAVVAARLGLSRKCLVLDLDNTLWGGVVGDDGIDGITLGGDGLGEAFVAFQEYVLELKNRGVILAVASKNDEANVREVFERHPHMRLQLDDVAAFAVNWDDKPTNLRRLASQLSIGLDALVLADDNPAERQIVRQLVPEVDVLALPENPVDYRRTLSEYLGFEPAAVTAEDRRRTAQYRARAVAEELRSSGADIGSFLRDLRMRAVIAPFDELRLARVAQLVGKTNQFNLTTRRHTLAQLREWTESPAHVTRYVELADRLEDHGLIAVVVGVVDDGTIDIDTLLMSCRVIGRTVEARILAHLCAEARRRGLHGLRGTYVPSPRNGIVADLYERFGFRRIESGADGSSRWEYDLRSQPPIETDYIEEVSLERHA